jgi:hypothetical protein
MSDSAKDILLDDPLSGETRTKRKFLLVSSLIGIDIERHRGHSGWLFRLFSEPVKFGSPVSISYTRAQG